MEVVVALAIVALGLSLLMAAASTGLGNAHLADQTIEATRRAQSRLAEVGATSPLGPGLRFGDDGGGFSWRSRISSPVLQGSPLPAESSNAIGLYTVEVTISWRTGNSIKSVSLQSKRAASQ